MRIFNEDERSLAHKPGSMDEVRAAGFVCSVERYAEIVVSGESDPARFDGTMDGLDALCEHAAVCDRTEFLAVDPEGRVYAVNTEGAEYARYAGEVGLRPVS